MIADGEYVPDLKKITDVHEGLYGETDLTFTDELPLDEIDVLFFCTAHGDTRKFMESQRPEAGGYAGKLWRAHPCAGYFPGPLRHPVRSAAHGGCQDQPHHLAGRRSSKWRSLWAEKKRRKKRKADMENG